MKSKGETQIYVVCNKSDVVIRTVQDGKAEETPLDSKMIAHCIAYVIERALPPYVEQLIKERNNVRKSSKSKRPKRA